ncbi:DUF6053 domain-containing protein [Lysobacter enzymogenes]|uniref:DUF6053 domain-containing protein n=1 Tax=Lysobacter enzymogenes TaxID=69 RepID=UPI003D18E95E
MAGPSGPMLLSQVAAIRAESIGPEGPPTTAVASRGRESAITTKPSARSVIVRSRLAPLLQESRAAARTCRASARTRRRRLRTR